MSLLGTSISALPADLISESLAMYLQTGEHSDLVVKCGDKTWDVHKVIVGSCSPFFRAACQKNKWKEGQDSVIVLTDQMLEEDIGDPPTAVGHMFDFMYRGKYGNTTDILQDVSNSETDDASVRADLVNKICITEITTHISTYVLGDKYDVCGLKAYSKDQIRSLLYNSEVDETTWLRIMSLACKASSVGDKGQLLSMFICRLNEKVQSLRGKNCTRFLEQIDELPGVSKQLYKWVHNITDLDYDGDGDEIEDNTDHNNDRW